MFKMDASLASASDVCPVCKSTAQTSPNLRFKVSSRCYHRICEGCVDRKFSAGKALCPISGCQYNLWKRDWRLQTYEDVQVERQVDIIRRVWSVFDLSNLGLEEDPVLGWEAAFVDLKSYNDYLEMREELAMNITNNIDKIATEKKIRDYEIANRLRKDKDDGKGPSKPPPAKSGDYPDASGLIKGLKVKYIPPPRSPYNAFQGVERSRGAYDALNYLNDRSTGVEQEDRSYAGYSWESYVDENLLNAFAGLGVLLSSEKSHESQRLASA